MTSGETIRLICWRMRAAKRGGAFGVRVAGVAGGPFDPATAGVANFLVEEDGDDEEPSAI